MEETIEGPRNMQAEYLKKQPTRVWDPVHVEYPVRKFPDTGKSSTSLGHDWVPPPEVLKQLGKPDTRETNSAMGQDWIPPLEVLQQPVSKKDPLELIKEYYHDYNVDRDLMRSQTTLDFVHKHPETKRHNKHTSCVENQYIYPPSRRLEERPPQCRVHGSTEMRSAYKDPETPARLVTGKEQYVHPTKLPTDPPPLEPSWHKELEPLDTTHDGFEKYLDPYLTTSRLHNRPYTADQLCRESNAPARTVTTFYTFSGTPVVRTPKPKPDFWRLYTTCEAKDDV
ncbi:hypothetical protein NE865_01798 [Phthorimaea operculella]|nr:hypothetical protein NE865_01798 [Phthorimaea operculella]